MSYDRATGERLVAAANPRFKTFRVDFEKVSNAASKAAREGRDGLDADSATHWFLDRDWHLRGPLQARYAESGAWDELSKFHHTRFKTGMGRNEPWPDVHAQEALDLMVGHGRADLAVALARAYVDMQHKRLKRDYSSRNPRRSRVERTEEVEQVIAAFAKAIAAGIPDLKADLIRDIAAIEPLIDRHGGAEDRAWLDRTRRELWMEKRA